MSKTGLKTNLVIKVSEFPIKPISFKGKYFKRLANSNYQAQTINEHIAKLKKENSRLI